MWKDIHFCHLQEIYLTKRKKIADAAAKTKLDALKTTSRKTIHQVAETTG